MERHFTISFRGNLVELEKHVLQALPGYSHFTENVQKQHNLGLAEMLQQDRNDLIVYVNRSSSLFNHILDYIEHGELHYPQYICPVIILKELEYWGYSEKHLGACCLDRILKDRADNRKLEVITKEWINCSHITQSNLFDCTRNRRDKMSDAKSDPSASFLEEQQPIEPIVNETDVTKSHNAQDLPSGKRAQPNGCFKQKLSRLISDPLASWPGKVWLIVIMSAISLSMITLLLECEPRIRHPSFEEVSKTTNLTLGEGVYYYYFQNSVPELWIVFVDFACAFILTLDFIVRCFVSEKPCSFLIHPCNFLDILSSLSVWIIFVFAIWASVHQWTVEDWKTLDNFGGMLLGILHLFRILRFRLILLHFKPLRIISLAYKRSIKDLVILSCLLTMASMLYGFLIFYMENFFNAIDSFPSGLHAQWWAFITMTTVGYGDFFPKTDIGYLIGISCAMFGIVIVAMTTTIIITNFMQVYKSVETIERKNKYIASTNMEEEGKKIIK